MSGRWDVENIDMAQANTLGDALRAVEAEEGVTLGVVVAAHALCLFNICGFGALARKRGRDVSQELVWFLGIFMQTIGELVESRYDHN